MKWFLFFFYDPQNQRFSKTVGSDATYYVYSNGKLLGEYDDSGALLVEYVYLNGRPLAQVVQGVSTEEITYFHVDHQGTPRVGTDSTGASVWTWSYLGNAFGDIAPTGTATVNLRFAGQYYDSESELFYNWNRYYDPATGRYVSSDPIGLAGGLNTFAYAGANPALYTDPEGLNYGSCMAHGKCDSRNPTAEDWANIGETILDWATPWPCIKNPSLIECAAILPVCKPLKSLKYLDEATGLAKVADKVGDFTRKLDPADLGLKNIDDLKGTFSVIDGKATARIDYIQGSIDNPFDVIDSLINVAKANGARSLRIEGTLANERLLDILRKRYGASSNGADDVIDIVF